ncbi:MAG: efflux RND transporter periplasmic adaptor subunit [Bacteroidia bacterium]|nr:efflux RND transporter periplasmic adaptor subunit [Bacteroidia bacterium]
MKHTNFILLLLILSCLACNRTDEEVVRDDRIRVTVVPAEIREIRTSLQTSGQLSSKTEIKLSFKTGGVIEQINVKEGQSVLRGDILARLNLAEVNAMEQQAELGFLKAERDYQRVENLYNDSVATLENLQDAKTALQIASANMEIARFNKKYSVIMAPSNGKILLKLAEENEIVGQGQPVFLFGSSEEEWVVKAGLTDRDVVNINLGDPAVARFDAYPDVDFQAVVSEIGKAADPYTGTYEVELSVKATQYQLASGFVARVKILAPQPVMCLQIPIDALVEAKGNVAYIFIAVEDHVEKRRILTSNINGMICVTEGLEAGEIVVTEGAHYLKDKDEILIPEK